MADVDERIDLSIGDGWTLVRTTSDSRHRPMPTTLQYSRVLAELSSGFRPCVGRGQNLIHLGLERIDPAGERDDAMACTRIAKLIANGF